MDIKDLDRLIKEGNGKTVQEYLSKLSLRNIPREARAALAKVATRVGAVDFALKILSPIIRDRDKYADKPTSAELSEYSRALSRVGGVAEAFKVLHEARALEYPDALLIRAGLHMGLWDYFAATPYLEKYLKFTDISDYDRVVGRSNLYGSLVFESRFEEAEVVSEEICKDLEGQTGFALVRGFYNQVRARHLLKVNQFAEAKNHIEKSFVDLKSSNDRNALFASKWKAIVLLHTEGPTTKVLEEVDSVRKRASDLFMFETVREMDLFEVKFTQHQRKFEKLYFGTPYPRYQERIMSEVGPLMVAPKEYVWDLGSKHLGSGHLNLTTAKMSSGNFLVKPGSDAHNLIKCLASDFYSPLTLGSVFSYLFKGEHYDVRSAKTRVQTAVSRTNSTLKAAGADLQVAFDQHGYKLSSQNGFSIQRETFVDKRSREGVLLRELESAVGGKAFSSEKAGAVIHLPKRTVIRILNFGLENGVLERSNAGRATQYRFRK